MTLPIDPGEQPMGTKRRRPNPGPTRDADDLFSQPVLETPTAEIRGMVRGTDSIESQRASVDVAPERTKLQRRLLAILVVEGGRTARELEDRAEFSGYGPSTIRKRLSELKDAELIVQDGRRDKMAVWIINPEHHNG